MSNITTPEAYGATGNGISNDTTAVQSALDDGRVVQGKPGAVYSVTNITIPSRDGVVVRNLCLQARSGGDDHYLIASANYLNNVAATQQPVILQGCIFDANSIAENGLILQNWNSDIEAECFGAVESGLVYTAQTRDGTEIVTTQVDGRFKVLCHNNGGYGMKVQDAARNKATDGTILAGSVLHSNGGYGLYIDAGAGWDVCVRTYNNGGGHLLQRCRRRNTRT